jgi:hypothetical protein
MRSYPKIFNLGHGAIKELFLDEVQVEEKIDGSQFSFGVYDGVLKCRSKGVKFEDVDGYFPEMFNLAVATAKSLKDKLNDGWTYRCEYLNKPKHNCLEYDRVPKNFLIIFDVDTSLESYITYDEKKNESERLGLECVPLLYKGKIDNVDKFNELLNTKSCLGDVDIEGVVIKNYARFGTDKKVLMAKFVNEKFKEVHKREWKQDSGKDILTIIGESLKSEARWLKAIQHLSEKDELENSPRDIGLLLKEINKDIALECEDLIKEQLLKWGWKRISKIAVSGFPQWYKELLAGKQFKDD